MMLLARLRSLWRNLRHTDRVDRDLDNEVRAVFEILVDEKVRAGLSLEQARRAATLELGRVDAIKQQVREERAGSSIDAVVKDVRYGARMLRANPGFTLVVVLSLAAGIGANSAIFSVANALLFRTLPVPAPEQLHAVRYQSRLPVNPRVSYPFFTKLRDGFPGSPGSGRDEPRRGHAPADSIGRGGNRARPAGLRRILRRAEAGAANRPAPGAR